MDDAHARSNVQQCVVELVEKPLISDETESRDGDPSEVVEETSEILFVNRPTGLRHRVPHLRLRGFEACKNKYTVENMLEPVMSSPKKSRGLAKIKKCRNSLDVVQNRI